MNETDRAIRSRCAGSTIIAIGRELETCSSNPAEILSTSVALLEAEVSRLRDLMDAEAPSLSPIRADPSTDDFPF